MKPMRGGYRVRLHSMLILLLQVLQIISVLTIMVVLIIQHISCIYAPNARKVYAAGSFNSWNATNIPMRLSLDRSVWWVSVNNTSPGQEYKFVIEKHDGTLVWVPDPAARKQKNSTGNSVIVSQSFTWSTWTRPNYDYYNIYQIHIRTFYTNGSDYNG